MYNFEYTKEVVQLLNCQAQAERLLGEFKAYIAGYERRETSYQLQQIRHFLNRSLHWKIGLYNPTAQWLKSNCLESSIAAIILADWYNLETKLVFVSAPPRSPVHFRITEKSGRDFEVFGTVGRPLPCEIIRRELSPKGVFLSYALLGRPIKALKKIAVRMPRDCANPLRKNPIQTAIR